MRTLVAPLIAMLVVSAVADHADAQRRRRRQRRQQRTEQVEAQSPQDAGTREEPAETDATPAPNPFDAPEGEAASAEASSEADAEADGAEASESDPAAAPSTTPTEALDPGPAPPDISPIRADYVTLMDELVQARMRVHALGSDLFRTRIKVDLQDRTGNTMSVARMVVHLDGAPVFQSDGPVERAAQGRELFTGALAPGPHVLTLEIEQRARADDQYRYTLRHSFRFQVTRERLTEVTLVLEDGSDIARSFPAGGEGRYEIRTRVRVATRALPE